jgi:serine phosphatase RsbU (regulator of sigma subunit)
MFEAKERREAAGPSDPPSATGGDLAVLRERCSRQEREIESLCREVLERYEEATFLYRLSERIGAVLGEQAIAELVLRDVIPVFGADRGEVWLSGAGGLALAASYPAPSSRTPAVPVVEAVAAGRTWVVEDAVGSLAGAAVPLPNGDDGAMGAIVLAGRPVGRGFRTGEMKLLTAVASLASAFLRNDRLAEKAHRADARRREDEIARQVHQGLLPRQDPLFAGLDVSGGFRPAEMVSGDYYGYVAMADGSLGLAIADVSGHGVGAALYMATAKGALQSEAREALSPADILGRVNEVLASDFAAADMFATLTFVRFWPDGRRLAWANAGHNPPLLLRAGGDVERLSPSGPALGIVGRAKWHDAETRFDAGDLLVVYTDGLVEARDADRRFYGVDRLVAAARRPASSAEAVRLAVLADLDSHSGAIALRDDLTLVVVRGTALGEAS